MDNQDSVPDMSNACFNGDRPACEGDHEVAEVFCKKCGKQVPDPSSFCSTNSLGEFITTGYCQICQDFEARKNRLLRNIAHGRR